MSAISQNETFATLKYSAVKTVQTIGLIVASQ